MDQTFRETHRTVDSLMVAFMWLHVPLVLAVAWACGTGWQGLTVLATGLACVATTMRVAAHGARATRMVLAVAFVGMVSILLAAFAGNAWQVDMHMYYFAALAIVAAYCDWHVIVLAAAVTALHHLVLNFAIPALVFPGGVSIGRVFVHAIIVVIEAAALVWMTQRIAAAFAASAAALAQSETYRLELQAKTARAEMLLQNNQRLRALSDTDGLTGIGNRRFFDNTLSRLWREGINDVWPLGLLLMDIDHFKQFNDTYGHQAGDRCLLLVADLLRELTRESQDIPARFGGEEFTLLLPRAPLVRVQAVGERIRGAVEDLLVPLDGPACPVRISIGCASMTPTDGEMAHALIASADAALYCAKRGGRNRIHPPVMMCRENVG